MRQLMYLVKEQNFFDALKEYFKDFAWKNATIDNLLFYM